MKDNSLSILKNFTRKLANCRYRVAIETLVDDLKKGGFGYTVAEGKEEVVNNDFVLADDFETLLKSIRVVFRDPRLHLRKEDIVLRAEAASKQNVSTINATFKDEKLWRVKDGEPKPEYVHSYVYEDNHAIYENRFVCFVVDRVLDEVSKKINSLANNIETLDKMIKAKKRPSSLQYIEGLGEEMPMLVTDENVDVQIIQSLVESKKWLISLKHTPLYQVCKKEGVFNPLGLKPTNILTKDPAYYNIYNFYLNYLNKEPALQTEQGMYMGYATVHMFCALREMGFTVSEETSKIGITNSGALRYTSVEFTKGLFRVVISQEDGGILMSVKTPDENEGKYLFKVLSNAQTAEMEGFTTIANYISSLPEREDLVKTFIVNDVEKYSVAGTVYLKPNLANAVRVFTKVLKSCLLAGVGSKFMYSRYCPVCGSSLIASDGQDISCSNCYTKYHLFENDGKEMIWFKHLPDHE